MANVELPQPTPVDSRVTQDGSPFRFEDGKAPGFLEDSPALFHRDYAAAARVASVYLKTMPTPKRKLF
jgi:hypothetical protein